MRFWVLVFLLILQLATGQTDSRTLLKGKINSELGIAEGVNVINSTSEKSTTSDKNGFFEIFVKAGDMLIFSAINLKHLTKKIENKDLNSALLVINMTTKTTELQEVIISKYPEINANSLGISPAGIKKYTPAERRLLAAGEFHWYSPLLIPLGGMSFTGLLNSINGRTKRLKKELEVEKKEHELLYLESLFKKEYYASKLNIPQEYVKGFQFYCLEDSIFRTTLKSKNQIQIEFTLLNLANKYKQIISDKN